MDWVIGYARCKDEKDALKAHDQIQAWRGAGPLRSFHWDAIGGQRGLTQALYDVGEGDTLVVRYLSDLSRDVLGMLRTANKLIERKAAVVVLENDLRFWPGTDVARFIKAAIGAHGHYTRVNIRLGVLAARHGGANIGRPRKPSLLRKTDKNSLKAPKKARTAKPLPAHQKGGKSANKILLRL